MKRDAVDVNIILELIITKVLLDVVLFQGYGWFRDIHKEKNFFVRICYPFLDRNEICLKGLSVEKKQTDERFLSFFSSKNGMKCQSLTEWLHWHLHQDSHACLREESITWRKEVTKKREERLEVWSTRSFSFPEKGSRWGTRESCFVLGLPSFSSFSVFLLFPPSLSFFPFLLLWGFISGLLSV